VPVAVHFELFDILVKLGVEVSSKAVADQANEAKGERAELSESKDIRLNYCSGMI
jgi:hypothetical protein